VAISDPQKAAQIEVLKDEVFECIEKHFPQEDVRKELATQIFQEALDRRNDFTLSGMEVREYLLKMACMLHPAHTAYQREWACELANFEDEEKQKELIAEVGLMLMEELSKKRQAQEEKSKFYTDFIGGGEVLSGKKPKPSYTRQKLETTRKAKKFQTNVPVICISSDSLEDAVFELAERAPQMDRDKRNQAGSALSYELKAHEGKIASFTMAVYYLTAAYIAAKDPKCFSRALDYIEHNVKDQIEMKAVYETMEGLHNQSEKDTHFYKLSSAFIKNSGTRSNKIRNILGLI